MGPANRLAPRQELALTLPILQSRIRPLHREDSGFYEQLELIAELSRRGRSDLRVDHKLQNRKRYLSHRGDAGGRKVMTSFSLLRTTLKE